ncbi:hypothetical protein FGG08_005624 [Glutinoglossum americanum]|uniref:Uncharacterized protein n=1 Tax=Glutinoglossum americanum TaxID=1670608 RepID=A0A9P8I2L8_9PEZI|nr:hypothetical protein FGG08_005624 [Glutinoglossum americanum]
MSIFSKLRAAKRAADEAKGAEKESKTKSQPAPYKHIPTHAAVDALSGAPSAWKAQDVPLIKAQHQRRSQLSRTNSVVVVPESSRYSGYSWNDRGDRRMHPGATHDHGTSSLGKSVTVSKEGASSSSSGDSTPSQLSHASELRPPVQTFRSHDLFASLHKSTQRKVGEAPILEAPPKRPAAATTPQKATKKWQFNKKLRASGI